MNRSFLLIALWLTTVAAASALQFTAPPEGSVYEGTSNVTFEWDEQPVDFSIGSLNEVVNGTSYTVQLAPGSHIATISAGNASANRTVTVTSANSVTITTDAVSYEAGSAARLRITVQQPAQLQLQLSVGGQLLDSYTVNVQQQTDFLYTLSAIGQYTALVTGSGMSASTSFSVQNSSVSVLVSGSARASAGRVTSFEAQASGGTPPYTYFWQFSDNTTSTGASVQHVFSDPGNYSITVIATDTGGKQASASRTIEVLPLVFELDVTVFGDNRRLLRDATVSVTRNSGGRADATDSLGSVSFEDLPAGNYTVNVTYNDTLASPARYHTDSRSLELIDDDDIVFTLPVPDYTVLPAQTNVSNTTNSTTSTNASTTPTVEQTEPVTNTVLQDSSPAPTSEADLASLELEQRRTAALDALRTRQFTITRSDEKLSVLTALGRSDVFSTAQRSLEQAGSEAEFERILSSVPTDVELLTRDTEILRQDIDALGEHILQVAQLRALDPRALRYNVEQELANVTITAKRSIVRIHQGGASETYTVYTRRIDTADALTFVEIIPKEIARDASALRVDGSHEVLETDPVIRFLSNQYSYAVIGESPKATPVIIPLPYELTQPPGLVGMVTGSIGTGGLYGLLAGALLCAIILGNMVMRRRRTSSSLPAFTDLADLTISLAGQGNYAPAARHHGELHDIHAHLPEEEREQTREIMAFIDEAAAMHEFVVRIDHVRNLIEMGDTEAIANAYESVVEQFENLQGHSRAKGQQCLDELHVALEEHIQGA